VPRIAARKARRDPDTSRTQPPPSRAQAEKLKAAGASHLVVEYDEIGQRLLDSVGLALDMPDASGPKLKI
jgi:hypothetical protein